MKKKIAIVAGGDSSELEVSLRSAEGLHQFISSAKYEKYTVVIIGKKWEVLLNNEHIAIDKNDFSFTYNGQHIRFDFAYITIHGTPGENGILQGYFDLIGLPYSCCGVLAAALSFNKFCCNQYLKNFGVRVADSILLRHGQKITSDEVIEKIGLPCFIKPNLGGSSFGVSKVTNKEQIQPAINKAFAEGGEVIIEHLLKGTEISCGAYKTKQKSMAFPITEILTENDFFDYDAKYNGQVTEITPARLSASLTDRVQKLTMAIYNLIGAKGIIRIDYIIEDGEKINLLEVNTTPGMTATSFIPQQVKAAGIPISQIMEEIIENEF